MSEEDIAARYFVSVAVVRQRLRLAAVSTNLLDLYVADELSLDQLMAFSVTGDHQRQEAVWEQLKAGQAYLREAYHIKRLLTEAAVAATDRRAAFIGLKAYESAGGTVLRDLFHGDNGGWLQDAVLLDRLVGEKLQAAAEALKSEGWKWIEVIASLPFDHFYGLRKLEPSGPSLGEDDQLALTSLREEYDAISVEYEGWEELGQKNGNYWMVGDACGAPGRSMHVRLRGPTSGKGAAGKWSDEATGEHGNLLDIIRLSQGLADFREVMAEACRFLTLPDPFPTNERSRSIKASVTESGREFATRLFTSSQGLAGSIAETYLNGRGIKIQPDFDALRFHPRCFHGSDARGRPVYWPALVAAVTDLQAELTGISRGYLDRDGNGKAQVDPTRRAKGDILGHGIRFGLADDVQAVGEGLETTLSLRAALPAMPLVAATSSSHLQALIFPPALQTLLVVRDNDHAGDMATDALFARGRAAGIEVVLIEPELDDLNSDLMKLGRDRVIQSVKGQLPQTLIERFMTACS